MKKRCCGNCLCFYNNTCQILKKASKSENDYCYRWVAKDATSEQVVDMGLDRNEKEQEVTIETLDEIVDSANNLLRQHRGIHQTARTFPVPFHETWNIFDASKINEYLRCPRSFFYKYVLGWDSEYRSHDLDFGTSWHIAMEHLLLNGYSKQTIIEAHEKFRNFYEQYWPTESQPDLEPKTSAMAFLALLGYVQEYSIIDHFSVLYTEVSGSVNVLNNRVVHFRIDCIAEDERGIFSLEHKTTKTLERTFQDKWSLDVQPNLYNHVLHCMFPDKDIYGIIINGTCLYKQGPRSKKPPAEFLRVPVIKQDVMMEAWIEDMEVYLQSIVNDYDKLSNSSDSDNVMSCFTRNPTACTDFWGCRFHDFCISWANPLQYYHDVPTGFIQKYWNPAEPKDHPPAKYIYSNDGAIIGTNV